MGISQICLRHERNLRLDSDRKRSNARRALRFYGRRKPLICWAGARSLEEQHGVGPFIADQLRGWIEYPSARSAPRDPLRHDFVTVAEARKIVARDPTWSERLRGDLRMHTSWSDGSGTVADMGQAADLRGYEYIAIMDHSKGLKIAGGIDESELLKEGAEIAARNAQLRTVDSKLTVLRSIEMNLNPRGGRGYGCG